MRFLKRTNFVYFGTTTVYGGGAQIATNISDIDTLEAEPTIEIESAGTVAVPNELADTETRKVLINENTLAEKNGHLLPTAVANLAYTFICNHTDGIRVTAAASDTIRVDASKTKAAGYVESTTVGSAIELVCIDGVEWVATSIVGTWVVETS